MTDIVHNIDHGAILYDSSIIEKVTDDLFVPSSWPYSRVSGKDIGGRDNIFYLTNNESNYVLRHYNRGGVVSHFIKDSYFWSGAENTRSFSEWRLLQKLFSLGLPVPKPVAARYKRYHFFYKADLITVELTKVKPLARYIIDGDYFDNFWQKAGAVIAKFHNIGLFHADLNAYNIQIDDNYKFWLIDFDKSYFTGSKRRQRSNLTRLKSSIKKIIRNNSVINFCDSNWEELQESYSHSIGLPL